VAAKEAERLRRQQQKEKLILAGVILVMIPGMVAYLFGRRLCAVRPKGWC